LREHSVAVDALQLPASSLICDDHDDDDGGSDDDDDDDEVFAIESCS
jgi:hypothetical protein